MKEVVVTRSRAGKDLQDYDKIFSDIEDYLTPAKRPKQLEFHALEDFLAFKSPK